MKFSKLAVFLISIIFLNGCLGDNNSDSDTELAFGIRHDRSLSQYEEIALNTSESQEFPDFSPVVFFDYSLDGSENKEFIASGVLINEEWILTAGHNFFDIEEQENLAPISGINVLIGNDPNNPIAEYSISEIVLHPTWENGDQDYSDANDLSLVRLSKPINSIVPAVLNSSATENIGAIVWHAGFGDYSETKGQNPDLYSKKHAIQNILDRKVSGLNTMFDGVSYSGGLLAFDFDDPDGNINSLGDNIINEDEQILGAGTSSSGALSFEGATVSGDSGGPLFIFLEGRWVVAGILSGGASEPINNHEDASYGDISIYTRVSTTYDWIISVIE
ncbi:MAG: S1 family peptidase [Balneola sp.]